MSRTLFLLTAAVLLATASCSPDSTDSTNNSDTASDQSSSAPDERTMLVLSDGLRLRSEPDQGSEIIQLLREGTILSATGRSDTPLTLGGRTGYWYRVRTPGDGIGWVFGAHLDTIPAETAAALLAGGPWDQPSQADAEDIIGRSWGPNYGDWGWGIRFYRNGSFNARYIGAETRNRFGFWRRLEATSSDAAAPDNSAATTDPDSTNPDSTNPEAAAAEATEGPATLEITYIDSDASAPSNADSASETSPDTTASAFPPPGRWHFNTSPASLLSRISLVHESGRELYNLTDRRPPGETVTLEGVEITVREETRNRVMGTPELLALADRSPVDTLENRSTVRVLGRTTLDGREYAFVYTVPDYGSDAPPTGLLPVDAIGFAAN